MPSLREEPPFPGGSPAPEGDGTGCLAAAKRRFLSFLRALHRGHRPLRSHRRGRSETPRRRAPDVGSAGSWSANSRAGAGFGNPTAKANQRPLPWGSLHAAGGGGPCWNGTTAPAADPRSPR